MTTESEARVALVATYRKFRRKMGATRMDRTIERTPDFSVRSQRSAPGWIYYPRTDVVERVQ